MPRLRSVRFAVTLGASLLMAASVTSRVPAQMVTPEPTDAFRPAIDGDPRHPGRFRRTDAGLRADGRSRFGDIPTYGNPPASGAGTTGFDSTNALRRRARTTARPQPGGPRTARHTHTTSLAMIPARPSPQIERRGATAVTTAAVPLVPVIATPTRRRAVAEHDPFEPVGIRTGAFTLWPAVELTGGYDSNPSHTSLNRGSSLLTVAPELRVRSNWARHALNADVHGTYSTYFQEFVPSLDRPALDSRINGRIDVTGRSRIDLEGRLLVGTDNPGSPNLQAGLAKFPIFTTVGGTMGLAQRFNRFELSAKGGIDRTVFRQSTLTDGTTAGNDDRNVTQYAMALRGSYELTPGVKPFVEVGVDTRVHDLAIDRTGAQRDSNGRNVKVGTTFEITRKLTGEASVGYLDRRYKDPSLRELTGYTADASLIWTATPLTTFRATARSTADEVVIAATSGVLRRDFGLQVDHAFRRWLVGTARFGYGTDDYVGSTREDQRYSASAALTYKLTRTVQIKGEFRRDWLNSTVSSADYTANVFLLGVRLQR